KAKLARHLLVGLAHCDEGEHVALARGEARLARQALGELLDLLKALGADLHPDRGIDPGNDLADGERLLDEVESAAPDRIDRHRNIALRGCYENGRRAILDA